MHGVVLAVCLAPCTAAHHALCPTSWLFEVSKLKAASAAATMHCISTRGVVFPSAFIHMKKILL
jgi:hypothetical protein